MPPPAPRSSTDQLDAQIPGAFPTAARGDGDAHGESAGDGGSSYQTLAHALHARRAEYTRPRNVRIKVGTWNTASHKDTDKDVAAWFVHGQGVDDALAGLGVQHGAPPSSPRHDRSGLPGGDDIGLYVLGLQEVVDIASPTEALRPYTDPAAANRWKESVALALPHGYQLVAEQQLIGLLLLVYAHPDLYPHVGSVSTTSVGTGLMGYMGNKGAVTARIVLGETTRLVFVNCHLAAGADKTALERRNWDSAQITSRTRFDAIPDAVGVSQSSGESIDDADFAFWFGDLNYRLEGMPGEDVRRLLSVHTSKLDSDAPGDQQALPSDEAAQDGGPLPPELDPASLQTTITSLLPHDELHQQQRLGKAFHEGWDEGPIRFFPTYKYDVGTVGVYDSSEKRRGPSWCDRILYRTRAAKLRHDARAKEQEEVRKRDLEMQAKGLDHAGDDEEVLFDYDPDTDGETAGDAAGDYDEAEDDADPEPQASTTKDGFTDEILLEYYACHMKILSSDHKPLEAIFNLTYDAVIPELKTAIHQEVARELDRQENEGRPSITVVVDRSTGSAASENKDTTDSAFDGVDFGDIQYAKSKRRNVTIANTGRVPATFSFADRPVEQHQDQSPFPPWLAVTLDREPDPRDKAAQDKVHELYTIQPAEVCNVELKLHVDVIGMVKNLNESTTTLDEILVLRVLNGRDHFLPIRGRWLQSSLARSIDKLTKVPEGGIRALQHQKPKSDADDKVRWSVPREIFRLTGALEDLTERTIAEWEMMKHEGDKAPWHHDAGWPFVKDERYFTEADYEDTLAGVYAALDSDTPFDSAFEPDDRPMQKLEILAEVLLNFLKSLQDGVITAEMWQKLEERISARERSKPQQPLSIDDEKMETIETLSLSPAHNATFLLLGSMLQRMANEITSAAKPAKAQRSSVELPASPKVSVRRKTLSKIPEVAVRQLINRNYASVFADAMIRAADTAKLKDRERSVQRERMLRVVEVFLQEPEESIRS